MTDPMLRIEGLTVATPAGEHPVAGVSFELEPREILGIAGPSGAGKSLTALSILGLLPSPLRIDAGRILWRGEDLIQSSPDRIRSVRQSEIGIVFQEAQSAFHPCYRVHDQLTEALLAAGQERHTVDALSTRLLASVGVPDPSAWGGRYPHEWSGGMRQRGLVALALSNGPDLLIADEPTSSLDVTVQAQIMDLLVGLRNSRALAMILISHDLTLLARYADRIAVMDQGTIVETGSPRALFDEPQHAVTRRLVQGWKRDATRRVQVLSDLETDPLLQVRELAVRPGGVPAVRDVSLVVGAGECVAVVGESGCGKSTLVRAIVGLERPAAGQITFGGRTVHPGPPEALRHLRRETAIVFQDPGAALNPRRSVGWSVARPLQVRRSQTRADLSQAARRLLARVGLPAEYMNYRPHQLSGGERQRVAIARALSTGPRLVILDEPFSALDAHLKASLVELLDGLRTEFGLSYLLVSHDLRAVRAMANRIYVVYLGRVVEVGPVEGVLHRPRHPYTRALMSADPSVSAAPGGAVDQILLAGEVPNPLAAPSGCAFRSRCWRGVERCSEYVPPLDPVAGSTSRAGPRHDIACFNP